MIVDGIPWAVVRSIGTGRRHVAVRDAALNQVARERCEPTGMAPLLDAIAASLRHGDLLPLVAADRPRDVWLLALAWLSRDQECRFDKLLDWRSADSGSGSLARNLSVQRLLDTLRALIDAVEPEEQTLREEIRALEAERDDARAEPGRRTWEVNRLRSRLTAELDGSLKDLPSARMAVEPLREAAKANVNRLAGTGPDADATDLDALRTEHDAARRQVEELWKERSGAEARVPEIRTMISRMEASCPGRRPGSTARSTRYARSAKCPSTRRWRRGASCRTSCRTGTKSGNAGKGSSRILRRSAAVSKKSRLEGSGSNGN